MISIKFVYTMAAALTAECYWSAIISNAVAIPVPADSIVTAVWGVVSPDN